MALEGIGSYPKIWNLGHPQVELLFDGDVLAQEKVDGSQISFMLDQTNGRGVVIKSKGALVYADSLGGPQGKPGMFQLAVDNILARRTLLHEGWVYRGEFLSKPKHNTLAYDTVPTDNIVLFDVEVGEQTFLGYSAAVLEAARIGLDMVPQIIGHPELEWSLDLMNDVLGHHVSYLGGQLIEGIVFKNYWRWGIDGKVLMGKYVSEAFKETHKKDWKTREPGHGDIIQTLGDSLRTDARWRKAVQHLAERGELQNAPQDIGPLMKELRSDLEDEEAEAVKQALYDWAMPKVLRIAGAGLPEWYKQQLAASQFNAGDGREE